MDIKYYGQSCFEIKVSDKTILIDPFISENPLAKDIDLGLIRPDYILITHGHGDHTLDAESIAGSTGATIVSNYEITTWYAQKGIEKTHGMNIGGSYSFPFGSVKMVNALHSSSMPDGSYGGNPVGYVISSTENTFYHAGDTGLFLDMKIIGEEFQLDFAILPIGDNFTMGIDDALLASDYLNCKKIVAMHFDTFPVIAIDHEECKTKAGQKGVNLIIPEIGESINI